MNDHQKKFAVFSACRGKITSSPIFCRGGEQTASPHYPRPLTPYPRPFSLRGILGVQPINSGTFIYSSLIGPLRIVVKLKCTFRIVEKLKCKISPAPWSCRPGLSQIFNEEFCISIFLRSLTSTYSGKIMALSSTSSGKIMAPGEIRIVEKLKCKISHPSPG